MAKNQGLRVRPELHTSGRRLATELLVQNYVSTQRDLLNRMIVSGANATAWHRVLEAIDGVHREQWRQVIGAGVFEAVRRLNGNMKVRLDQLSRLFRQPGVTQESRDRLIADLESLIADTRVWEDHVGRIDASYQRHVAIAWLGLRHTIGLGLEPAVAIQAFGIVFEGLQAGIRPRHR